jgi:hypothetical protein
MLKSSPRQSAIFRRVHSSCLWVLLLGNPFGVSQTHDHSPIDSGNRGDRAASSRAFPALCKIARPADARHFRRRAQLPASRAGSSCRRRSGRWCLAECCGSKSGGASAALGLLRTTTCPGIPTTTEFEGTVLTTTAFAPMRLPVPIVIAPKIFAPAPTTTLSSRVGCRFPLCKRRSPQRHPVVQGNVIRLPLPFHRSQPPCRDR